MNRPELIERIIKRAGLTKANADRFYEGLIDVARNELVRNGRFVLPGLGALTVRTRKARTGRNPRTGQTIQIPQKKVVRFRAFKDMNLLLNPSALKSQGEQPQSL